jgi:uncharacterized membrane protein YsdA (DUF1294 family)
MLPRLAFFLILVNAITFVAFTIDKRRARSGRYRISERMLLALALAGGTPAALYARRVLRHKTYKEPFRTRLFLIAGTQAVMIVAFMTPSIRDAIGEALLRLR